jgi:uncharacterized protein
MKQTTVYFDDLAPGNTESTFELARERAKALGVAKLVLASTTGATARRAMDYFNGQGVRLIVVPHQHDFRKGKHPFPEELAAALRKAGHEVHFGTMLFHTYGLYGNDTPTVMANLLRCFSQGVKVCFEIVLMATDAGLTAPGERVIAVAGTARGADTALVMQAASSQSLRKLRVNELICKPYNPLNIDEVRERYYGEKGKG